MLMLHRFLQDHGLEHCERLLRHMLATGVKTVVSTPWTLLSVSYVLHFVQQLSCGDLKMWDLLLDFVNSK